MTEQERTFADTVPSARESTFEGTQVKVEDLLGQPIKIIKAKYCTDDNGEWADFEILHDGEEKTFITASAPLMKAAKTMQEKELLKSGSITATIESKKSKTSRYNYYQFV